MTHKTIFDIEIDSTDFDYNYQNILTERLDKLCDDFNQAIIDQIVLWKVNRYVNLDNETLTLLNKIDRIDTTMDIQFTRQLLGQLLKTKGIRLSMASTILRFKNPNIYQIIDQRAYRMIYENELKIPHNADQQIDLYINYLSMLRETCNKIGIEFSQSDRILYWADKQINHDKKIKY